jgi:hypothetical protein
MVRFNALYAGRTATNSGPEMSAYWKTLKGRITLAVIVFGMAFLASEYQPFRDLKDFLNSVFILSVIFFGDVLWNWIKARMPR